MVERMTGEEFNVAEAEVLAKLPEEFRAAVSWDAYDRGHAYGYEEVLIYVKDIVDWLLPCIQKYDEGKSRVDL